MRDGTPLPGQTPAQLLSQLAHRVLGPLRPHRIRAVLDYHGLREAPAAGQAEIAARYGVNVRSVSNWVTTVAAAGAHLPLSPEMATQINRRSRPGEDHRGRARVASTFGLPPPARPLSRAPAPRPRIPPDLWAAAGIAVTDARHARPTPPAQPARRGPPIPTIPSTSADNRRPARRRPAGRPRHPRRQAMAPTRRSHRAGPLPTRRRRPWRPGRQPQRTDPGPGQGRLHPLLGRRPHHHDPPTDHPRRTSPVPADRTHRAGIHRTTATLTFRW